MRFDFNSLSDPSHMYLYEIIGILHKRMKILYIAS